eukprot:EC685316.1.p2 GENE.EC685316.1~~EC685316.1.p2  ORF type:complete len:140 (+),score=37.15 EC685316.1:54-473(+)
MSVARRSVAAVAVLCMLACALVAHEVAAQGYCATCGSSSSYTDINAACSQYSGWSQQCCTCIANAESSGNLNACNLNNNGSTDVGLWQVNSSNWDACNGGSPPCSLSANLQCAIQVWQWGGNTWQYWSTCSQCGCCNSP